MKFTLTIKSKNVTCEKSRIIFNKIEIYKSKVILYFSLDNFKKYQQLIFYFVKKRIIKEKQASYIQD